MDNQDWKTVTFKKSNEKQKNKRTHLTERQVKILKVSNTEVSKIKKIDKKISQAIMQARIAKKLTRKQLANLVNEKTETIAKYENQMAIPNLNIIKKLERQLTVKLTGNIDNCISK